MNKLLLFINAIKQSCITFSAFILLLIFGEDLRKKDDADMPDAED